MASDRSGGGRASTGAVEADGPDDAEAVRFTPGPGRAGGSPATGPGERLTPAELKERFAGNLDRLISLLGLTRADAAAEIGLPYPLLRRLVSAGVSRIDRKNAATMSTLAGYFALPAAGDQWRPDLVGWLLSPDGPDGFVEKHRARLTAERERRLDAAAALDLGLMSALGEKLGDITRFRPRLAGPVAEKVATVLASVKAAQFRRLIDDYHEFVTRAAAPDATGRRKTAVG